MGRSATALLIAWLFAVPSALASSDGCERQRAETEEFLRTSEPTTWTLAAVEEAFDVRSIIVARPASPLRTAISCRQEQVRLAERAINAVLGGVNANEEIARTNIQKYQNTYVVLSDYLMAAHANIVQGARTSFMIPEGQPTREYGRAQQVRSVSDPLPILIGVSLDEMTFPQFTDGTKQALLAQLQREIGIFASVMTVANMERTQLAFRGAIERRAAGDPLRAQLEAMEQHLLRVGRDPYRMVKPDSLSEWQGLLMQRVQQTLLVTDSLGQSAISFALDAGGNVLSIDGGDEALALRRAVLRASPLPPPPDGLAREPDGSVRVTLNFEPIRPPRDRDSARSTNAEPPQ